MTVASSDTKTGTRKIRLPSFLRVSPRKGQELLGLLLGTLGLLLLLALVSHAPTDPSLAHQAPSRDVAVENWIGPLGAETSAAAFLLVGLSAFLVPLFLFAAAWGRLVRSDGSRVFGRGLGLVILLTALPALLHLTLGQVGWRGGALDAGGAFGMLVAETLESRLSFTGTLLVLLALVVIGSTLVVQSTLGEILAAVSERAQKLGERWILARDRWRERRSERRERERRRQRVVQRHMERRQAGSAGDGSEGSSPSALDVPLRVRQRPGEGEFSVRRVAVEDVAREMAEDETSNPARSAPTRRSAAAGGKSAAGRKSEPEQLTFGSPASRGALPPLNLLRLEAGAREVDEGELVRLGEAIRSRCAEFGVEGTIEGINPGPVITVFEFQPAPGVKVSQIVNLQDDLALALKAESVRIDRLPGRSTLGIEVPNKDRALIRLGSLIDDERFQKSPSLLTFALGETIHGEPHYADLTTMPHLLVAGATGSGKSVGLQSMITSVLYKARPEEVKFIFIDPKRIELGVYKDIPHLAAEVVVNPKKAANALQNMVKEMERRYKLLAEVHVRSIAYYNRAIQDPEVKKRLALNDDEDDDAEVTAEDLQPLPYYVIVIDELADLMTVASSEVETAIARLAQMARAVGIHLIVATQRPSVDVLTGTIKANFPCRIAFATASRHDSRTILDQVGSEKLLGKGDMLFMPPGTSRIQRLHGAYVSEQETAGLVRWLKKQGKPDYDPELLEPPESDRGGPGDANADDELYDEAARLVVSEGQGSASFLQRRLRVGFSRASRLIDMMEVEGIVGPPQGSKPRDVLVAPDFFEEVDGGKA